MVWLGLVFTEGHETWQDGRAERKSKERKDERANEGQDRKKRLEMTVTTIHIYTHTETYTYNFFCMDGKARREGIYTRLRFASGR